MVFSGVANCFDALTVKQWEIMINNEVLLFSAINEETCI